MSNGFTAKRVGADIPRLFIKCGDTNKLGRGGISLIVQSDGQTRITDSKDMVLMHEIHYEKIYILLKLLTRGDVGIAPK